MRFDDTERRSARVLLGGVGFAALVAASPIGARANDFCLSGNDVITCSGNQSGGIWLADPDVNLVIENLTGDIAPPTGTTGVMFDAEGPIHVTSNTGAHAINATGISAGGIDLHSSSDNDAVSLDHTGNITAGAGGIRLTAGGAVETKSSGTVTSGGDAIHAESWQAGVIVQHTGTLDSTAGYGVYATGNGSIKVTTSGDVTGALGGLVASSYSSNSDGTVTIDSTGKIVSSGGYGISAVSAFHAVSVTSTGAIESYYAGIYVKAEGSASDSTAGIVQSGNVTSSAGVGVYAEFAYHTASVKVTGDIQAHDNGVTALSKGSSSDSTTTVTVNGKVTSSDGRGIDAESAYHSVVVAQTGDVQSYYEGIFAKSTGTGSDASVSVTFKGKLTSSHAGGIVAESDNHAATVTSTGDVAALTDAIVVKSLGTDSDSTSTLTQTGNLTSTNGDGAKVYSANHAATATITGDVKAGLTGVDVQSTGDASDATAVASVHGDITATDGYGIYAKATNHGASVTSTGAITAGLDGIYVESQGAGSDATALVTQSGKITAHNGAGIKALATQRGVVVDATGDIDAKTGIHASSTGAAGDSTVHVTHTGKITTGTGVGIQAYASTQSATVSQTGDIVGGQYGIDVLSEGDVANATIVSGTLSGATDAEVQLAGVTGTQLSNSGAIIGANGALAIKIGGYGTATLDNYGTVTGAIDVATPDFSTFTNKTGALLNLDSLSFAGGNGQLINGGTLSPGGKDSVHVATVDGAFHQAGNGTLLVDVDDASHDRIDVSNRASLEGNVKLHFINLSGPTAPITVVTSTGLDASSLTLLHGPVVSGTIAYPNATDAQIDVGYNFAPGGLDGNAAAYAGSLDSSFHSNNNPSLGSLFAGLANIGSIDEYAAAMQQLSPAILTQSSSQAALSNMMFADRMLSCRVNSGAYVFNAEGECSWFSAEATSLARKGTAGAPDVSSVDAQMAFGVQRALSADLRLGVAFGYDQTSAINTLGSTAQGGQTKGGIVLKYVRGPLVLATSVTAGLGAQQTMRQVSFGGFTDTLIGQGGTGFVSGRLHATYTNEFGSFYVRPQADLDLTGLHAGGYTETGGPSALSISSMNQTTLALTPALELGGQIKAPDGTAYRPYVRVGAQATAATDLQVTSTIGGGLPTTYAAGSGIDPLLLHLDAGLDVVTLGNTALRLYYDGTFGPTTTQQTAGVKFSAPL